MEFYYENQNSNSFLVYKLQETDKLDSFNYGMLANNKINGIIPGNLTQINADKYLKYNVSAMVTLKQYFEGIVNKKRIINVFTSIASAIIDAEDYMIDISMFMLDTNYIFVDVSSANASILCFPIVGYSSSIKPVDFFKNIIFTTQYDRTENSDYVAEIITFLNSSDHFSLPDFKKMLLSLDGQSAAQRQPVAEVRTAAAPVSTAPAAPKMVPPIAPVVQPAQPVAPPQPVAAPAAPTAPVAVPAKTNAGPIQGTLPSTAPTEPNTDGGDGKKMSFMHLLSNFSKENLELYKAQKNGADESAAPAIPTPAPKKEKKSKNKAVKQVTGNPVAGFAIPGQNNAVTPSAPAAPARPVAQPKPSAPPKPAAPAQPVRPATPAMPKAAPAPVATPTPVPAPAPVAAPTPVQPVQPSAPTPAYSSANFGATTTLGAMSGGTTVLGASPDGADNKPRLNPRLIRSKTMENIAVNKPVFRIGKEHSYVDYFISDNSAISRSHANIITRDDSFFLVDTNSTNHTYINGVMLQSNVETLLNDKDMVRFANEDYEFRIY